MHGKNSKARWIARGLQAALAPVDLQSQLSNIFWVSGRFITVHGVRCSPVRNCLIFYALAAWLNDCFNPVCLLDLGFYWSWIFHLWQEADFLSSDDRRNIDDSYFISRDHGIGHVDHLCRSRRGSLLPDETRLSAGGGSRYKHWPTLTC